MVSRSIKGLAIAAAAISFSSAASAGAQTYGHTYGSGHYTASSASYTTTLSPIAADARYGTGSISQSYTLPGTYAFSGSTTSVAGLGYGESLRATSCPVNVHGTPAGASVLGCYNVVKQVPQTTYYRVVRPVIYVRYPVAAPCATRCCEPIIATTYSRYGGYGPQGGYGPYGYNYGGCR